MRGVDNRLTTDTVGLSAAVTLAEPASLFSDKFSYLFFSFMIVVLILCRTMDYADSLLPLNTLR